MERLKTSSTDYLGLMNDTTSFHEQNKDWRRQPNLLSYYKPYGNIQYDDATNPEHETKNKEVNRIYKARQKKSSQLKVKEHIRVVQEFEGLVESIDWQENIFYARLMDLTANHNHENYTAELPIDDIRDDDKHLLQEGAIFNIRVAYKIKPSGSKRRFTEIIFRRIPKKHKIYKDEAKKESEELANYFEQF